MKPSWEIPDSGKRSPSGMKQQPQSDKEPHTKIVDKTNPYRIT